MSKRLPTHCPDCGEKFLEGDTIYNVYGGSYCCLACSHYIKNDFFLKRVVYHESENQ